ncbi:MAG: bifunctional phosphoglucose/phosphomannose isomerase [Candidatus Hodarchaeota archaeon]
MHKSFHVFSFFMSNSSILDDAGKVSALDPQGMLKIVEESTRFMKWCIDTLETKDETRIEGTIKDFIKDKDIRGVFIVGMGGSAISGDVAHDWLKDCVKIPILVIRGYELPAYIDGDWVGIFLSYSGNTEETLSTFASAKSRGISGIGITSGGLLEQFLGKTGEPCIKVPGGYQPRAAMLYLFTSLAITLAHFNLCDTDTLLEEIRESLDVLMELSKQHAMDVPMKDNEMKQVASILHGSTILVYGFDHLISVARRFKGQVNENGKNPSYYDFFPELNHNETVGWEIEKELASHFSCVFLRDPTSETEPVRVRIEYTQELIAKKASAVIELHAKGTSRLAKMLSLIYMADFISVYLALLNGKDPTPVNYIQGLKDVLKNKVNMQDRIQTKLNEILKEK